MNTLVLEIVTIWGKKWDWIATCIWCHTQKWISDELKINQLKTCIFIYTYMCVYMILSYLSFSLSMISKSTYIKEKRSKTWTKIKNLYSPTGTIKNDRIYIFQYILDICSWITCFIQSLSKEGHVPHWVSQN